VHKAVEEFKQPITTEKRAARKDQAIVVNKPGMPESTGSRQVAEVPHPYDVDEAESDTAQGVSETAGAKQEEKAMGVDAVNKQMR
jgi:hypothetical protein